MTLLYSKDAGNSTGYNATAFLEDVTVAPNAVIASNYSYAAIELSASFQGLQNYGFLSGGDAVNLAGGNDSFYNGIGAEATGAAGVLINSSNANINNDGVISGSSDGIFVNPNVNNFTIINTGKISGISAIDTSQGDSTNLTNSGLIVGLINLGGDSVVKNAGVFEGDLRFSGGTNSLSGAGGTVDGNVAGGAGVDTFDLSHQTVTGLISGGAGDDVITGTAGNDIIDGGTGADHLDGGLGINTATYQDATAGVSVDLLFNGSGHGTGDALGDTLVSFENLTGSAFADTLEGDGGNNVLDGGAGNDLIYGRGGNDTVDGGAGNDIIYAGAGNGHYEGSDGSDLISFANLGFGVTISLAQQGAGTQTLGASTILIDGFENLSGTPFADTLSGDGNANTISGAAGDDHINGGLGNDTILGGAGNDTLVGGGGIDTVSYADATAGVTVSLAKTVQQNTVGSGLDTISGFANLTGSAFADTLTGTTGDNVFAGLGGKDVITGGGGHDTFTISAAPGAANLTTVTDFSPTDDIFALNRAVFGALPAGSILASGALYTGTAAHAATDRIIYNSATGDISYDADGNGAGHAIVFAHVATNLALTSSDFHIYG